MNLHELSLARSLAYHRVVASRLDADPDLLVRARRQAQRLASEGGRAAGYGRRWLELLQGDRGGLLAVLTGDTEEARELRSCTPFAGALSPRERWDLWKSVRAEQGP